MTPLSHSVVDPAAERYEAARAVAYLAGSGEPFTVDDVAALIGAHQCTAEFVRLELDAARLTQRIVPADAAISLWRGVA